MLTTPDSLIQKISDQNPRFERGAYYFVLAALQFTQQKIMGEEKLKTLRHVSGQELARGMRDYALREYGPSAMMVFDCWGVRSTFNFGQIVYELISVGLVGKTENDRLEDFKDVYDFKEEFISKNKVEIKDKSLSPLTSNL